MLNNIFCCRRRDNNCLTQLVTSFLNTSLVRRITDASGDRFTSLQIDYSVKSIGIKKPVSLINSGNNCFLNSLFQSLIHQSAIIDEIERLPNPDSIAIGNTVGSIVIENQDEKEKISSLVKELKNMQRSYATESELNLQPLREALTAVVPFMPPSRDQYDPDDVWQGFAKLLSGKAANRSQVYHSSSGERVAGPGLVPNYFPVDLKSEECQDISTTPLAKMLENAYLHVLNPLGNWETTSFEKIPPFFTVTAKRFQQHSYFPWWMKAINYLLSLFGLSQYSLNAVYESIKLKNPLNIPFNLNLNKELVIERSNDDLAYNLSSFIVHFGDTTESGHYVSYVKKNNRWYECSDKSINEVSIESIENLKQDAYMCFYNRATQSSN
ncbi:MAG: hypothetical protein COT84_05265 [Chlamydiae bacterium CG10_big_fil_rev_8_21_14_0_10_35_9]|nr:MAG: hypothetical protein COT84_05265 [Chlamydiae bacterium CG10_big_fil_rev_8_21_14_0_10_35_9]